MNRPITFYFTRGGLAWVVTLEMVIIVGGAVGTIFVVFGLDDFDVRLRAVLASILLGLSGSGAYYLRRIYRAAFDERLLMVEKRDRSVERIGAFLYLLGRPVISISLTLATALGVILAYTTVAPDGATPTGDLVYLTGSFGFITGFLSGRLIAQLEISGRL